MTTWRVHMKRNGKGTSEEPFAASETAVMTKCWLWHT